MLLCLAYTARGEEIEKDTAKIRNVELNEVVVQSFKQQRDLRLEPLSASAVTGTAIQNRNITGIKEFSSFIPNRSEERRVGKECRSRWSPYH